MINDLIYKSGDYITVVNWKPATNNIDGTTYIDRSYTKDVLKVIAIDQNLIMVKKLKDHHLYGNFILNLNELTIRKVNKEFAEMLVENN